MKKYRRLLSFMLVIVLAVTAVITPAVAEPLQEAPAPTALLEDDFSGDLSKWTAVANAQIVDGAVQIGANGYIQFAADTWTDYVLTVDFNFGGQPYRGISFRRQENGDDYLLWFGDSELGTQIVKRVNGGWEPISEAYQDMKLSGGEHRIKLEVKGSEFKVWVDGAPILTASDEELTKGGILFFVNYEAAWIDNVSVTVPGEETEQLVPDSYDDDPFGVSEWQYENVPLQEVPVGTLEKGGRPGMVIGIAAAVFAVIAGVAVAVIVPVARKKKVTQ